jgi:hypothetical protein
MMRDPGLSRQEKIDIDRTILEHQKAMQEATTERAKHQHICNECLKVD